VIRVYHRGMLCPGNEGVDRRTPPYHSHGSLEALVAIPIGYTHAHPLERIKLSPNALAATAQGSGTWAQPRDAVRWLAEPDLHLAHTCVKPGLHNADNQVTYALCCAYKNKEMLTQLCRSSANPNGLVCENLKKNSSPRISIITYYKQSSTGKPYTN
jgi:hypothetical protein